MHLNNHFFYFFYLEVIDITNVKEACIKLLISVKRFKHLDRLDFFFFNVLVKLRVVSLYFI